MAKKQNPYQLWLGLPAEHTNPNLFQLLGVDPLSKDETAIKQKVVASTKTLLKKLKAVEPKSDTEKVFKKKLHAKIVLAHETLSVPGKRKQYLKAIVAKETGSTPPGGAVSASPSPSATASPQAPPANPPAEIPAAIPMAMPVSTGAQSAPAPAMTNAAAVQSGSDFDNFDAGPQVRVRPMKRRTSRSWLVPIVVLVFLVGGVGGIISVLTKYHNVFELYPGLIEAGVVVNDPNAATPTAGGSVSNGPTLNVPEIPLVTIEPTEVEGSQTKIVEDDMPLGDEPSDGSMTKLGDASKEKPEMEPEDEDSGNPFDIVEDEPAKPKRKRKKEGKKEGKKVPAVKVQTLPDRQLNALRLALHRSRDALFRQDLSVAKHFNGDVQNLLKRFKIGDPETITPEQRGLVSAVKTNEQIIDWVDDFWKQVKTSSIQMAGGTDLTVGNKTMGLVEGRDKDVVLRIAGQNVEMIYTNLTPILAQTLGELGSKRIVPRWNLAQAAYFGVMVSQYDDVKPLQSTLLNKLNEDGYDLESQAIADYTKPDWLELGLPQEKFRPPVEFFSDDEVSDSIAGSRADLGYEDPSRVPEGKVDEIIYTLTLEPRSDAEERIDHLWEAIAVIKKGHRFHDLMFVNRELNQCCTKVDFNRSFVDPILHILKAQKDQSHLDRIARQTLIFIKEFDGNQYFTAKMRETLLQTVQTIAQKLKDHQLAAMAEQLSQKSN